MKKLFTNCLRITLVIVYSIGFASISLGQSAYKAGAPLETGGLYTALAKDNSGNLYVTRVQAGTSGASYEVVKYTNGTGTPVSIYSPLTHELGDYPWGLAVAGNGDVYIATDFTSGGGAIIKLPASGNSYSAAVMLQTGKYFSALAIDAGNNFYTAEYSGSSSFSVVKYPAGSGVNATGTTLYSGLKQAAGYGYPTGLAVAPNGDVYVADAFSNTAAISDGGRVIKLTAASSYSVTTVTTGNYATALAVDASGNLFSSENRGNSTSSYQLYKYTGGTGTGTSVYGPLHTNGVYYPWGIAIISPGKLFVADGDDGTHGGAIDLLVPATPNVTTNAATLVTGNSATLNGNSNDEGSTTTVNFTYGTSPTLIGGTNVAATTGGTINPGAGYTNASANITGLTGSTTYYYRVFATNANGSTVGSILNFTTKPAFSYASPQTYTTNIAITPLAPTGNGAVPAPAYGGPVTYGSGFSAPTGVAGDGLGNLYVSDYGSNLLIKIPAGGGAPVTVASGFSRIVGVAVDAANNVYITDAGKPAVEEFVSGGGSPVVIGSGFNTPYGVAVDLAGNVYVTDFGSSNVYKIAVNGGAITTIGTGFSSPSGVAVDAAGNVYVADYGNGAVKEIPAGSNTPVAMGSGLTNPFGVAADPLGNLFVADYGASTIKEIPAGGGAPVTLGSGYHSPSALTVAASGKLYVADYMNSAVKQLTPTGGYYLSAALPPGLNFASATGVITGTPTTAAPAKNYVVSAYDATGAGSAIVNIKVVSNDASLAALLLSSGTLTPAFTPAAINYTAAIDHTVTAITVTPTVNSRGATVKINGVTVASGSPSASLPMAIGTNTITTVVTAPDGVTQKTYTVVVTRPQSSDNNLVHLVPSLGILSPTFSTADTTYTIGLANSHTSITVQPTAEDPTEATITVNGMAVASGANSQAIALGLGNNLINTTVTAQDGTKKNYKITVNRAGGSTNANLANLVPSLGVLSPAFAASTTSYTIGLANSHTSITFKPTTADATATVTVNGAAVASGTNSAAIPLSVGNNVISTVVTAQDGITKVTYKVTVNRAAPPSSNANLTNITPNIGTLTPVFATGTTTYADNLANSHTAIMVRFSVADATATVTVNGTTVAPNTYSQSIPLAVGNNPIAIISTAQDGVTKITYTVNVNRAAAASLYVPADSLITAAANVPTDGILVHPGVSPNGDGINDIFTIDGINAYPENKVVIMGRNGDIIFEAKGYDNQTKFFDGHSSKNGSLQLPGTYFYSLEYKVDGKIKNKTGFIVLKY
jgi:gliding motility-associated-like protein